MLFIFCKNGRCVLAQLSPAFNIIYTQTPHTHIQKLVVPSSAVCASYRQVMRQHVAHVAKSENLISASIQHHSLVLLGPCFNFAAGSGVGSPLRYIWCWNSPNPQSLSYIFDASSKFKKKKKEYADAVAASASRSPVGLTRWHLTLNGIQLHLNQVERVIDSRSRSLTF